MTPDAATMSELTDAPTDAPVGRGTLAVLVVVPMALFSTHLVVAYTLISLRCEQDLLGGIVGGADGALLVTFVISVVGALVLVALALAARRRWSQVRSGSSDHNRRAGFLLAASAGLSALLVFYMVLAATMVTIVPACTT